jgi:uncharacterized membrane protein YeaQ/YmgE (transglycosylase-associated protein family)
MENNDVVQHLSQWANLVLVWVGFGTIVGLLAKAIMPGRDPGGALTTLAMGIGGTIIGCGTLTYFSPEGTRVSPISVAGFAVATAGAFIILFFYRLLAGKFFIEDQDGRFHRRSRAPRRMTRRPAAVVYEDEVI